MAKKKLGKGLEALIKSYGKDEKEQYLNNCTVLGESTAIPNTEIICVETEKELLLEWRNIILREDPDIIIGYNIFSFKASFKFDCVGFAFLNKPCCIFNCFFFCVVIAHIWHVCYN